jgi:hypothetical protein
LRADLASGEWDRRYGHLRSQPEFVGALRLITAGPTRPPRVVQSQPEPAWT